MYSISLIERAKAACDRKDYIKDQSQSLKLEIQEINLFPFPKDKYGADDSCQQCPFNENRAQPEPF